MILVTFSRSFLLTFLPTLPAPHFSPDYLKTGALTTQATVQYTKSTDTTMDELEVLIDFENEEIQIDSSTNIQIILFK